MATAIKSWLIYFLLITIVTPALVHKNKENQVDTNELSTPTNFCATTNQNQFTTSRNTSANNTTFRGNPTNISITLKIRNLESKLNELENNVIIYGLVMAFISICLFIYMFILIFSVL